MVDIGKLFRTGTGMERQYGPVTVHGYELRCEVCRHTEFWEHHVQLHTPAASFFGLDFANRIANCAVCAHCGYVHFFLPLGMAPADEKSQA